LRRSFFFCVGSPLWICCDVPCRRMRNRKMCPHPKAHTFVVSILDIVWILSQCPWFSERKQIGGQCGKKKCFRLGHIKLRSEFRNRFFSMTFNEKFDPDKQYKHQGRTLSKSPLRTYSSLSIRAVGRITVQSVGLAEEISFFRVNRWRCKPGRGD
jgi:hypothetical protein